jgi:hypothetical protein
MLVYYFFMHVMCLELTLTVEVNYKLLFFMLFQVKTSALFFQMFLKTILHRDDLS